MLEIFAGIPGEPLTFCVGALIGIAGRQMAATGCPIEPRVRGPGRWLALTTEEARRHPQLWQKMPRPGPPLHHPFSGRTGSRHGSLGIGLDQRVGAKMSGGRQPLLPPQPPISDLRCAASTADWRIHPGAQALATQCGSGRRPDEQGQAAREVVLDCRGLSCRRRTAQFPSLATDSRRHWSR